MGETTDPEFGVGWENDNRQQIRKLGEDGDVELEAWSLWRLELGPGHWSLELQ